MEFSLEDMDMSGFQNDATYSQIKERVLQQTGLKVSSLYIAQIKQKHGIIERENYNKPKSENTRQPKCGNYGSIEVFWDDLRIANIGEIDRKTVHATVLIDKTNYSL